MLFAFRNLICYVKTINQPTIIFFGTPTVAADVLQGLIKAKFKVVAIVTEPDKPAGRGLKLTAPAVKKAATALGLTVLQPQTKAELQSVCQTVCQSDNADIQANLGIIIAYGRIIPQSVIDLFPLGILNIHGSLLPKYRGAAPVQQAILDGLTETGVTIQKIDAGLDTGPILVQEKITIEPTDTTASLLTKMGTVGAKLLIANIPKYVAGVLKPQQQTGTPSLAAKLTKDDGLIDWQKPAVEIERQIRACNPWPRTYTQWQGKRLLILAAHLENGLLVIDRVQPEAKQAMAWKEWLNGIHLTNEQALDQIKLS
ncbi:MAG: methionyl-tRNA formyltransferase [bacterium]|nr:methionyl-tRNA formyltransferase [bacterium]